MEFDALLDACWRAPSCSTESTDTLDGVTYRHQIACEGSYIDAGWDDPSEYGHQNQWAIIAAYELLVADGTEEQ